MPDVIPSHIWKFEMPVKTGIPFLGTRTFRGTFQALNEYELLDKIRADLPKLARDAMPFYAKGQAERFARQKQALPISRLMLEIGDWWNGGHPPESAIRPVDCADPPSFVKRLIEVGVVTQLK